MFLRIHRSIIINTKRIKELQPLSNQVFTVVLQNGTKLTSGRHFRENFRQLLGE
jgi:two-component system LytT family response regulator